MLYSGALLPLRGRRCRRVVGGWGTVCVMESARSILTTAGPPVSSLTGTPVCGYSRDHNTARGLVATAPRGRTHRWQSHGSLVTQSACTPSRGTPGVPIAAA